ncbi:TIGR01777 family protein [Marinobacter salinexigens]|uniref:TIGR01777 family protein n=1 Tax=Marinobacter salinexigens TaxID=2919747 RepID=A0A5B0VIZ4_9GAMM|nr:TIGR01777 family oxidoreductase [Marinobacter salinexigens]KAA1173889.1 TIGR01777 family protein [Marinobacter salinexigens]
MNTSVLVTGGTGFIGRLLCQQLLARGHDLTILSRQTPERVKAICGNVATVRSVDELQRHNGFDAVINLAGEGIADKRWSQKRKQVLRSSRIDLTRTLIESMGSWHKKPAVLVSGSAVGFYGDQGSQIVTEQTAPNEEFTHRLCQDWEAEALAAETYGVRVCLSRTGIVVGPDGGFLKRMIPPFRLGLGGRLGNGTQFMPWIHRNDVVNALLFLMENGEASGPFNVVSPNPSTNADFTRSLGHVLNRPTPFPAPAALLSLVLGEMSRLLLTGQRAIPQKLQSSGFSFSHADLEPALADVLSSGRT